MADPQNYPAESEIDALTAAPVDGECEILCELLLDTVADAAAAAGVAVTGGIILATGGWYWLDPAVALVIAVVVAYHALVLVRKVLSRIRPAATDKAMYPAHGYSSHR